MRRFIVERILPIQQSGLPETVPFKSAQALFSFVEDYKEIFSMPNAARVQVVNTKKQHLLNF